MNAAEQATVKNHFHHPPFKVAMKGFSFVLPRDWEIVGYSFTEEKSGRFGFSSGSGDKGQFSWRTVKDIPDIPRIIEEVHRRELCIDAPPKIRITRYGKDGSIILGRTRQGERFYASVFNREKMLLCEWIFPKYSEAAVAEVVPMLESFNTNPAVDGWAFYALFGLEVNVPEDYHFVELTPLPAAVTMKFENQKYYILEVHRWGMADVVMQGANVTNFYHRQLYARKYNIRDAKTVDPVNGNDVAEIAYRARGKWGFDFLLGPWWTGFGSAFLRKSENRIYGFEHLASRFVKERLQLRDIFRRKLSEKD